MLDEDEEERVDETALRQLTEMGFPESRAVKALRLNQYVGPPGLVEGLPRDLPVPHSPSQASVRHSRGAWKQAPQSPAWARLPLGDGILCEGGGGGWEDREGGAGTQWTAVRL